MIEVSYFKIAYCLAKFSDDFNFSYFVTMARKTKGQVVKEADSNSGGAAVINSSGGRICGLDDY